MGRAEDLFARLENHGEAAIEQLLEGAQNEEAFLDFKRSHDDGEGPALAGNDRKNLARALSGFANSDGGVLIWGIGTGNSRNGDAASTRHPLNDCGKFASQLDDAISGCTVPAVTGARSIPIFCSGKGRQGYVATLIPNSNHGPHQLVDARTYLMRSGSSFQPVPHAVLAGMFGKRPQPQLSISPIASHAGMTRSVSNPGRIPTGPFYVESSMMLKVRNDSGVLAKDAYVSWEIPLQIGIGYTVQPRVVDEYWIANIHDGRRSGCVAAEKNMLVPFSEQLAVSLKFQFTPPFLEDFELNLVVGCSGTPPKRDRFWCSKEHLSAAYEVFNQARLKQEQLPLEVSQPTISTMFGMAVKSV